MATRYVRLLIAAALLSTALWLLMGVGTETIKTARDSSIPVRSDADQKPLFEDIHTNLTQDGEGTILKHHGIKNIRMGADVATLRLHTNFTDYAPPLLQELQTTLTRFARADSEDLGLAPYTWPTKVQLLNPGPRPDASTMIFGIASTLIRVNNGLEAMFHWAAGTKCKIIVLINPKDEKGDLTVPIMQDRVRDLNIDLEFVERDEGYIERFTLLLSVLHQYSTPDTQWAGLLDDDTFFPSISRLMAMLRKYNYKDSYYVGGVSEDLDAIHRHGYMAFGGAGIFLSRGLLETLQPHFNACRKLPVISQDARVALCIYRYTTTKLTWERQLVQFDMYGDYSGVFESVRPPPISVHHWKSWGNHDMILISKIARVCGDQCIFQKFELADGWFMTNGFSIVKFSELSKDSPKSQKGPPSEEIIHQNGSMERTWKKVGEESPIKFLHSLAPLRNKDEGKRQYLLENVVEEDEGVMTFYYVKRDGDQAESIIRVLWTRD